MGPFINLDIYGYVTYTNIGVGLGFFYQDILFLLEYRTRLCRHMSLGVSCFVLMYIQKPNLLLHSTH